MKRIITAVITIAAFAVPFIPVAANAAPAAPFCGITWGSGAKSAPPMVQDHIRATRVGEHACFDRLSVDMGGKPVPGYNTRIVDEHGRELGTNEIGELIVRGPSAGEGYWNQRAKSRRTFAGEWTHTGDKYRRDADGYYYYCGRTDDMFKVSGMWVSPFDVEAALVSHEAVLEAAVIGKEDADGLIKPKAFIVLRNGFKADDVLLERLKLHVKDKAGPWKFPRWIELRTVLPRTATGKIQRFKLREEDLATR